MKNKKYILLFGGILLASLLYLAGSRIPATLGSAPSGLSSNVATTSLMAVDTTQTRIIATSTNCAARVITTRGASEVMLTFSELNSIVPTGVIGHVQAASTTVAYDSGLYGCNSVRAYSFSTQNLTITETR